MTKVLSVFSNIASKGFGKEELADYIAEKVNRMSVSRVVWLAASTMVR